MAMMYREGAENRFELIGFFILIGAFILAKSAKSAFASYFIVLLAGIVFGKYTWDQRKRKKTIMPVVMLICAFLVGFIYGGPVGDPGVQFLSLLIGAYLGYEIHRRGYGIWVH